MRRILLATLCLGLACAGQDHPTAPPIDPAFLGMWQLRTVNGQPLPYVLSQGDGSTTTLDSGSFTTVFTSNFSRQLNKVTTSPGLISIRPDADGGVFTVDGNVATFHFARSGMTATGTLSHDTLTVVEGSFSLALTR